MNSLTPRIKEILDTPDAQVNVGEAATVLLQVNRNRTLHQHIVRRNDIAKLKYELQKIYDFRLKDEAVKETAELQKEVTEIVKKEFPKIEAKGAEENKGMRADHEQLPDEVKAKYVENLNIFPRMRKLHEKLKLMPNAKPCDRYPFLKELKALAVKHRENWDAYDSYVVPPANSETKTAETVQGTVDSETKTVETVSETTEPETAPGPATPKQIQAARKYVSDNKPKLEKLRTENPDKYAELLIKVQERVDFLITADAGISEQQANELKELGINI